MKIRIHILLLSVLFLVGASDAMAVESTVESMLQLTREQNRDAQARLEGIKVVYNYFLRHDSTVGTYGAQAGMGRWFGGWIILDEGGMVILRSKITKFRGVFSKSQYWGEFVERVPYAAIKSVYYSDENGTTLPTVNEASPGWVVIETHSGKKHGLVFTARWEPSEFHGVIDDKSPAKLQDYSLSARFADELQASLKIAVQAPLAANEPVTAPRTSRATPPIELRLSEIQRLKEKGLITEQEYQAKRAELLKQL